MMGVKVYTAGLTVDYEHPGEEYPEIHVWFTVVADDRLPSIVDIAQALIMLGKMTDSEEAFEKEARAWLDKYTENLF
jgi:hypothetical protein